MIKNLAVRNKYDAIYKVTRIKDAAKVNLVVDPSKGTLQYKIHRWLLSVDTRCFISFNRQEFGKVLKLETIEM